MRSAAVLTFATLAAALPASAASAPVAVSDIEIVGTPKLYVQRPVSNSTYNAAWVVFRTRPHLHEPRQVVTELKGHRGRSFGNAGGRDCIRSTIIQVARIVRPGATYRVRFYGRRAVGSPMTLLRTYRLPAHRFALPPRGGPGPRCYG